jgi:hypothetical protein
LSDPECKLLGLAGRLGRVEAAIRDAQLAGESRDLGANRLGLRSRKIGAIPV